MHSHARRTQTCPPRAPRRASRIFDFLRAPLITVLGNCNIGAPRQSEPYAARAHLVSVNYNHLVARLSRRTHTQTVSAPAMSRVIFQHVSRADLRYRYRPLGSSVAPVPSSARLLISAVTRCTKWRGSPARRTKKREEDRPGDRQVPRGLRPSDAAAETRGAVSARRGAHDGLIESARGSLSLCLAGARCSRRARSRGAGRRGRG